MTQIRPPFFVECFTISSLLEPFRSHLGEFNFREMSVKHTTQTEGE